MKLPKELRNQIEAKASQTRAVNPQRLQSPSQPSSQSQTRPTPTEPQPTPSGSRTASRSASGRKPRRNKFGNVRTVVDGRTFDSKAEARRYQELKRLQIAGAISGLRLQVRFPLRVNGVTVANYLADFVYVRDGRRVVEDVKGMRTAVYKLKCRLMQAVHGIEILET